MDPQEEHNHALGCVLDAQIKTGTRGQEVLQSNASRLLIETRAWVQVLNKDDGSKSEIVCHRLGADLKLLFVDGREIQLE